MNGLNVIECKTEDAECSFRVHGLLVKSIVLLYSESKDKQLPSTYLVHGYDVILVLKLTEELTFALFWIPV